MTSTNARNHAKAIRVDDALQMLQLHHAVMHQPISSIATEDSGTSVVDTHASTSFCEVDSPLSAMQDHIDVLATAAVPPASVFNGAHSFQDFACTCILDSMQHSSASPASVSSPKAADARPYGLHHSQFSYTSKDSNPILFHSEPHTFCHHQGASTNAEAAATATTSTEALTTTSADSVITTASSATPEKAGSMAGAQALASAREQHYAQMHKMHVDAIQSAYAYASALHQVHEMQAKLSMLHGQLLQKLTAQHMLQQVKDKQLSEPSHESSEAYGHHASQTTQQLQPNVAQLTKEHCI